MNILRRYNLDTVKFPKFLTHKQRYNIGDKVPYEYYLDGEYGFYTVIGIKRYKLLGMPYRIFYNIDKSSHYDHFVSQHELRSDEKGYAKKIWREDSNDS